MLGDSTKLGPSANDALLWSPSEQRIEHARLTHYQRWLDSSKGIKHHNYSELWRWSIEDIQAFWSSIWDYSGLKWNSKYSGVLDEWSMPGAKWFPGASLNYAANALRAPDEKLAVVFGSERSELGTLTYGDLRRQTAAVAASLRRLGVGKGDRVAAYMPNIPETVVAFLATASIGAIWSSCSPDFGTRSVLERFRQIEPRILFTVDRYSYNGIDYDKLADVSRIISGLPSLQAAVCVPSLRGTAQPVGVMALPWNDLLVESGRQLICEPVAFDHPLWILYSSGTTGLPKAIVHGHGGIVLEHWKALALHLDLNEEDRFFWFTTTGWMMWNFLISGLLLGGTIVLYDGSPVYPDRSALWRFAERAGITYFGTSAPYVHACMKSGLKPAMEHDLSRLRALGSTGAPLRPEGFRWVYTDVASDVLLGSISGGTDVCTAFVGSNPTLPVYSGEIQCRALGAAVEAYDEGGRPVLGKVGELVVTRPMPSMPLFFWNDPDGRRYLESYFSTFPGVWRHGDWILITERGSCVIYGRSDATLNRGGVRMGTSDFYRVVEEIPEIDDSLVVDTSQLGEDGALLLFVALVPGTELDDGMRKEIERRLRDQLSPRHVPDAIYALAAIPHTLNGKKLEVPVRRLLLGAEPGKVISPDSVANPDALPAFIRYLQELRLGHDIRSSGLAQQPELTRES